MLRGARKIGLSHIIRAPISQERMIYIPAAETKDGVARVIYEAKDGKSSKTSTALDWLAQLVTHIPNKGEQLVRYYGYYSNKSRDLRKKTAAGDDLVPTLIEAEISREEFRRNWARLIQYLQYIPEIKETVYDDFSQLTPYDDDYSQVVEEHYS